MSTRSTIAIERKDGTRTAIYCHFDGYIEGVGVTLQLAYNTADKVEELLKLGDLSRLGYKLNGSEDEFTCIAYHRDRGEEFQQSDCKNEFNYTFVEVDNCWYVEKEKFVSNTPGGRYLDIMFCKYEKALLLDEILECKFDHWGADEFAKDGESVHKACIAKAIEARKEIIEENRREREAYYHAYCD